MKASKSEFVDFLNKVHVGGLVNELVLEEDGSVVVSPGEGADRSLLVVAQKDFGFKKRLGIANLDLLQKIAKSIEAPDNMINIEIKDTSNMVLASKTGKYNFRLADPDVIESNYDQKDDIFVLMKKSEVKLPIKIESAAVLKKAISDFSVERVAFYANAGKLEAIVYDDGTDSSASIEIGKTDKEFKHDFSGETLKRILEMITTDDAIVYMGKDQPLFVEVGEKKFVYMLSYFTE